MSSEDYSLENLISRKKRRKNRERKNEDLEKLFAELQKTPDEMYDSPVNADYKLEGNEEQKSMDMKGAVETAQRYLEREKSDRLAQILEEDEDVTSEKNYNYFGSGIKPFPPIVLSDEISTFQPASTKKIVYTKIYNLANDRLGRRQLISDGWLSHYHRRGLDYPLSVYRWLFQIAAYESDLDQCNGAKQTMLSLWKSLNSQDFTVDQMVVKGESQCAIPWQDFEQVLKAYGAAESEIAWARLIIEEDDTCQPTLMEDVRNSYTNASEKSRNPSFPISNARYIVHLFGQSIWQSQSSYSPSILSYVTLLLIQMSMDERCEAILPDIETAICCCLHSYDQNLWKKEVDNMVALLSSRILIGDIQVKSLNTLKSVSERSDYFRRTLALSYVLSGAPTGDQANLNQAYGSSAPCTPQSNYSEDMQSSNGSTPALSEVQNGLYPISIDYQIEPLIRSRQLLGLSSDQLDAHKLTCTINLLSVCIGDDEGEIKSQRSSVEKIIRSLQHIAKRIGLGGKVGSLDRTIAREVLERLWSRLSYVIGTRSHRAIENTHV
ncbi:hypothetical protein K450DRAFT_256172 [Umbelopsis ramanniana AG]|uniref:Uncharacterized protein n=1 Tax=Umbelopsis ramanniana AG TaxID=1314678 RepID=A0AAD5HB78_UMBRA|nr:uncharacterized protein K450DRAFT_256172 [Umbelopsis ramanniana AG]KAI8576554.1 hypothetical protein K450DRAFT_256172 [Umbelopsis ramanniana AG]